MTPPSGIKTSSSFPTPTTNVFTIGCYLADTDMSDGPLAVLPGSHNGPLYDQYGAGGNWVGYLNEEDAATADLSRPNPLETEQR